MADTMHAAAMPKDLIDRFSAIVGTRHALIQPADIEPYVTEQRGLFPGKSPLVLRPANTQEVSRILALANETGTPVVPQGGNTGLVGGGVPHGPGHNGPAEIVVSLGRMNRILDIDPRGNTMLVEAGVVLQQAQEAADNAGRLFPLSLGSQGSCQIGGNIGTNAGGTGVLAYGNTRELVMGLEVVLASGEVWNGLRRLKKDNTGYDLKDLFIGAEGTLGIVTRAVLKLFPKPAGREVSYAALASPADALVLLERALACAGPSLTAFELISRRAIGFSLKHFRDLRDPFATPPEWYVLLEVSSGRSAEDATGLLERILGGSLESGLIEDAVVAGSIAQQNDFWKLRENITWAQREEGGSIKHDISVPVASIPEFIARADEAVLDIEPDARIVNFGHMGDGNLHYNVSQPEGGETAKFMARYDAINDAVLAIVDDLQGSMSAEHGIGQLKRDRLAATKTPVELEMMRQIKRAFDPKGIMNPGKVL